MADNERVNRGWRKYRLIRALADGQTSQTDLAAELGCSQPAISAFAKKHRGEIERVRLSLADEYAGIAIADKANRLGEHQQIVDDLTDEIASGMTKDKNENRRIILAALRAAAEELGQIPNKSTMTVEGAVQYKFIGLDPEDLT